MENEEIIDVIKTESFGNLVKHPDGGFFYFADSDKNVKLYSYDGLTLDSIPGPLTIYLIPPNNCYFVFKLYFFG